MEKPKGMTTEDLAKALPLNRTSTAKYLNTLLVSGQIEQQVVGRARLFTCCSRVPMAQMLSFSSDSVIVMDSERMIREINPQFIESFGVTGQDLTGKKFDTLSSDVDITHLLLPGICQAVDGQSVKKTLEIKKGDKILHFLSKYLPVVLEDGRPGAAVVLENITESHELQAKYEKIQEENVVERTLRAAAEVQLARFPKHTLELEGKTPEELIHELQVNQIELEMQGEELRNSKIALIESRDKYLDLYDFAPVGYFSLSDKGLIEEVNLTGATLLRTERKDLVKTRFSRFIAEKDADQWHTYFMHVLKQKEKLACTLTLRRGDGSMFPAQLDSIRISDHGEGTPTLRVVIHNITDIRQLAEALGNSEGKLSSILNDITDVVWSLTWPDMKVHYISPSAEQVYGRPVQEFIDTPSLWVEVTHPDDKQITDNALEQLRTTGSAVRECRIVRPDGSIAWIHDKSHLVFDEHGTPIRAEGISSDITGRKQAEATLRESHDKFEATIASLDDAILLVDPVTRLISECNDAATRIFGYSHEELVGRGTSFLHVDHAHHEQFGREAMATYEDPGYFTREFEMRRKNGDVFPAEHFVRPIRDLDRRVLYVVSVVRDITGRKRAEAMLRQNAEQLALAIEGSGVGLWDWEVQTGKTVFNERWAEIAGYTLSELQPVSIDTWTNLCHPDDLQQSDDLLKAHFSKESPSYECEVRIRHKDGHWVWVLDRGKVVKWDSDGLPIRMTGTHLDITDRKMAEEMLAKSDTRYRTLVESSQDSIFIIARDDTVQFVNSRAARSLNIPVDEIIGKPRKNLFPQKIADEQDRDLQKVFETGDPIRNESEILFGNQEFWQDNALVPLKDETGTVTAVLGISRDITGRKRAEEELRESEEKYRILVQCSEDLIFSINGDGTFRFVNEAFARILNKTPGEIIGKPYHSFFPDEEVKKRFELARSLLVTGESDDIDSKFETSTGEIRHFSTKRIPVMDENENLQWILCIARDITERKRVEELLCYQDEMRQTILEGIPVMIIYADRDWPLPVH